MNHITKLSIAKELIPEINWSAYDKLSAEDTDKQNNKKVIDKITGGSNEENSDYGASY